MTTEYLLTEIEQLKLENAELKATIEAFAAIAIDIENSETSLTGNGVFVKNSTINEFESARYKQPSQHLADIKADAILSVTEYGFEFNIEVGEHDNDWVISTDDIVSYSNSVRNNNK